MSEALRLAELLTNLKITVKGRDNAEAMEEAAAELRRLHQSEREGWRWADELEQERKRLNALNAELMEALRKCDEAMAWDLGGEPIDTLMVIARNAARAVLAKVGESK